MGGKRALPLQGLNRAKWGASNMKSYLLPGIIAASVIAVATLIYALLLPSAPLDGSDVASQDEQVIEAPSTTTQTAVLPPKTEEEVAGDNFKLEIDIARVQADGMAVFAGRGAPNASIFITENGAIFAQNTVNEQGEWVILPEQPLSPGAHLLQLEMVTIDGERQRADVSLVVEIAEGGDEKPLVALVPQTDDEAPTLLQSPDEDSATQSVKTEKANDAPATQAEQVAEILGQEEIFIQIGSLSWNDGNQLVVHGVASGGDKITGRVADLSLEDVMLERSGRWKSQVGGDPFTTGDTQLLELHLRDANDKSLAQTKLQISRTQLAAGLDGSLMVVVHKGDALWRIAYRSYGQGVRYVDIFRRNADKISDPDLIYPNQIFAVPGVKN